LIIIHLLSVPTVSLLSTMRLNAAAAAAILAFVGSAYAQVDDAEATPSSVAERPVFTVSSAIPHPILFDMKSD
jgi:hypothetical protein